MKNVVVVAAVAFVVGFIGTATYKVYVHDQALLEEANKAVVEGTLSAKEVEKPTDTTTSQ